MTRPVRDCTCPRSRHEHGHYLAYANDKCRCDPCTRAWVEYHRGVKKQAARARWGTAEARAYDFAPSHGTVRRLRALAAIGWSTNALAPLIDMNPSDIRDIRNGMWTRCRRSTRERVSSAYDMLWDKPPPENAGHRKHQTIANAKKRGWVPPLAWDDIDDPDDVPHLTAEDDGHLDEIAVERLMGGTLRVDQPARLRRERVEAVRRLTALGFSDGEIARRVDISTAGVFKIRLRNDIPGKDTAA